MRLRRILLTCAIALAVVPLGARNDDGRIRITAIVTNARGEPLKGLRPRDFDVRADGVAQELESAQLTSVAPDAPRLFAFLLDEFHVDADRALAVRDALLHFIDTALRPPDRVIVLKPLDSLTSIEPAADLARVRESVASFQGRKGDYTPRLVFEQKYMPQAPGAVAVARAQIVTSALRALTARIAEMTDVRGAIVLVSDGFQRTRTTRESPADVQTVIRPATTAGLPVYVLSASKTPDVTADDARRVLDALQAVASQTGGEYITGVDAIGPALARVSRDLDTHYVLTYRPSHGEDGRFHALQLAVKRRDAQVRARGGYLAPMSAQMRAARAAARVAPAAPRPLRRSPLIQAWTGFTRTAEGNARVTVTWEPRRTTGALRRTAPEAVVLTASRPDGEVIFHGRLAPVGTRRGPDLRDAAAFEAPAGRLFIDINVVDASGSVLDFDARDLDVPDLQKPGNIILPASILRARSAREFRSVSTDPNASPVPSREFRRTDRLLVRVPTYVSGPDAAPVTATLLNGWRQPMRTLTAMPDAADGITQFDVPLAPLAPGEYVIRINGPGGAEHVAFRVTG